MAYVGHQSVGGVTGLITGVDFEDKFNAKRYRGLPNRTVVAGKKKLASMTLTGYATDQTTISASHTGLSTITLTGGGKSVTGIITELSLKGSKGEPVTFSVTAQGSGGSGGGNNSGDIGELVFLEDVSVSGISGDLLSFNLTASWDVEFVYSSTNVYPDLDNCIFKSFEGTLTLDANAITSIGNTLNEVGFSISTGGLTASGKGYLVSAKVNDTPDGYLKGSLVYMISELTVGGGG